MYGALVKETFSSPKFSTGGLGSMDGGVSPVPERATVAGMTPGAGEAMVSVAFCGPGERGSKTRLKPQLAPAGMDVPQEVAMI